MTWLRVITASVVLTAAAAAAVPAGAQQPSRVRVRGTSGRAIITTGDRTDTINLGQRHGRLGILVDMRPDASRDSIGALVSGLTPGGPAARAGVQIGDLVAALNGTALATGDNGPRDGQSRPAMRLINLASRLEPGDTVRLDLRRGGRPVAVTLVAAESDMDALAEQMDRQLRMHLPDLKLRGFGPGEPPGPPGAERLSFVFGGPVSDLELVKMNPGLGEYFGTQDGLLVVSVGRDTALGLRPGDVVLSIGGRPPVSPPHAMRILGTYEPNEAVPFEVMRQHRRVSVSGKMPARREHEWHITPNAFDPDMLLEELAPLRADSLGLWAPELHIYPVPKRLIGAGARQT